MNTLALPLNQIIQGNCLEVMRNFPDESIDLIIADPPYNLGQPYPFDNLTDEEYVEFNNAWLMECYRILKQGRVAFVFNSQKTMWNFKRILDQTPFKFIQLLIWHYTNTISSGKKPKYVWTLSFQPIFFLSKGAPTIDVYGKAFRAGIQRTDVWKFTACQSNFKKDDLKKIHISQKPLELVEYMVLSCSEEGEVVLDPFLGSGTTAVACKKLRRNYIGIEIDPSYCEMARKRLAKVTQYRLLRD